MQQQMTIEDLYPASWCGKTYPEPCQATVEKTSEPSLKKRQGSPSRMPLFLDLTVSGATAEPSWEMGGALLGEYTMRSFGESPKEGVESRLSQILQDDPLPKYCLSEKACQGILNRASRRGKELPPELKAALIAQSASRETGSTEPIQQDATAPDGAGGGVTPLTQSTDPQSCPSKNEPESPGGAKESSFSMNTPEPCQPSITNPYSPNSGGAYAVDCRNGRENLDVNGTLQAKSNGGYNTNSNNIVIDKR